MLLAGGDVRLAPLYDIASALPYDDMYVPKLRMAMRIGGEYRADGVTGRHWRRFAELNKLEPDEVVARVADLAARTPDCFAKATQDDAVRALASTMPARPRKRIATRVGTCRRALAQTWPGAEISAMVPTV